MKLRRRAVLKWIGAGLCALIFAVWLVGGWMFARIEYRKSDTTQSVHAGGGYLTFSITEWEDSRPPAETDGWNYESGPVTDGPPRWGWLPRQASGSSMRAKWDQVLIPLWIPFALLALPSGWLFYRDRPSVRWGEMGRCRKCGYDLCGLRPGAACPECGKWGLA